MVTIQSNAKNCDKTMNITLIQKKRNIKCLYKTHIFYI